ncbi:MAG TPA: hypothetical protein VF668_21215 [Pyrinomonadaceae bacterium]
MAALANIEGLLLKWRREGVRLLPPPGRREAAEALRRAGRPFAGDLVALYGATGGMDDGETDGECLTLWTPGRVAAENPKRAGTLLLFVDFLINSHAYGLRPVGAETSAVYADFYGDAPARRVADSLDEFFGLWLNDPSKIF